MTEPLHLQLDVQIVPEQTFTYIHLPFDVPSNIGRIDVAYTYQGAIASDPTLAGGNTVDIGLIDPRGEQFMTQGFRGWSGSARKTFYLAEDSATPGYLAGPIQPGTWAICLGAYKVAANGCDCHVEITLTPSTANAIPDFPARLPVRKTANRPQNPDQWYKGEIHCHTVHSDGDSTVEEVIGIAESLGLDFLAITDHNNRSQFVDLARSQTHLTLIPGYEVTTYYGHWNLWGEGEWIDFRVQSADDLHRAIGRAHDQGYLVSCNHPRPYGPDWAFPEVEGYACVEVWNGPWELLNDQCLAFWEQRLQRGQRLVAVGGSDFHFSKETHIARLAHPTTVIYCPEEPSAANLLRHLRAGQAFVTESPNGPRVDLRAGWVMMGGVIVPANAEPILCTLTVQDGAGSEAQICTTRGVVARFAITQAVQSFEYAADGIADPYVRAQIVDPVTGAYRAISNPIYIAQT
jgi:predicted metal-dependent phosphoesterase TrpH